MLRTALYWGVAFAIVWLAWYLTGREVARRKAQPGPESSPHGAIRPLTLLSPALVKGNTSPFGREMKVMADKEHVSRIETKRTIETLRL